MTKGQLKQIIREEYKKVLAAKKAKKLNEAIQPVKKVEPIRPEKSTITKGKLKQIIKEEMRFMGMVSTPAVGGILGSRSSRNLFEEELEDINNELDADTGDDPAVEEPQGVTGTGVGDPSMIMNDIEAKLDELSGTGDEGATAQIDALKAQLAALKISIGTEETEIQ